MLQELTRVRSLDLREALRFYDGVWDLGWEAVAALGRADRFFLLTHLLHREDAIHPWIYERCREVESAPNGHIDLWARAHYKSSLVTFAGSIQEILNNPNITIGIFSHNRPTAKKFLGQIKQEFESNGILKKCYPEILYENPQQQSPRWSDDRGIIVKRTANPKEATVEANGLVDGMPTGAHYTLRIYNDVVTQDSVTTPEMIEKTTEMWRLSQNLGTEGGRVWIEGTRYHFSDTYGTILKEELFIPRIHPATRDGTATGEPVLVSRKSLEEKRQSQGHYIFACQQLLNPVADQAQGFKEEWLRYHDGASGAGMNVYLLVDPANEKKKHSDYTAMFVVGLNADNNYYVLDIVRSRMNLTERADALFYLHKKWKPLSVGYEKYGKDSDIQHFEDRMRRDNYRFNIYALGGKLKKEDRIRKLIPLFEQNRVFLPEILYFDDDGKKRDLIHDFVEQEYKGFPVATHDDMLDCLARIVDPDFPTSWPMEEEAELAGRKRYVSKSKEPHTWMAV